MKMGARLKYYREKKGLTVYGCAKQIGVTGQALTGYENDTLIPTVATLMKITDYYGINLSNLIPEVRRDHLEYRYAIASMKLCRKTKEIQIYKKLIKADGDTDNEDAASVYDEVKRLRRQLTLTRKKVEQRDEEIEKLKDEIDEKVWEKEVTNLSENGLMMESHWRRMAKKYKRERDMYRVKLGLEVDGDGFD